MFSDLAVLMFSCVLINNILLIQYLGNCPFLGTSKKMETATGMAMAVVFVLVLAGIITWLVELYVLVPFDLKYLRTMAFILVIAALVQFVEMFLKKSIPALYTGLGIYLPLITTNCTVLGVAIMNVQSFTTGPFIMACRNQVQIGHEIHTAKDWAGKYAWFLESYSQGPAWVAKCMRIFDFCKDYFEENTDE